MIRIHADGRITFIWDDSLAHLRSLGKTTIRRVSDVEPTPEGGWTADLSKVGGPVLGPFDRRQQAIDAELCWLRSNGY